MYKNGFLKFFLFLGLVATLLSVPSVLAQTIKPQISSLTTVRGNVYNVFPGGIGNLSGLTVKVTCKSDGQNVTKKTTTDSNGLYTVNVTSSKCDIGGTVSSTTSYNGETLKASVTVSSQNTATLDLYF